MKSQIMALIVIVFGCCLLTKSLAQTTFPNPKITKNETIQGDLILTNYEVRTIQNTHLKVLGKVIVGDSSQLIIRQSIVEVDDPKNFGAVASGSIEVIHWGRLFADTTIFGAVAVGGVDPANAESLKSGDLIGAGNSQVRLNHCFSQTQGFFDHASAVIKNSYLIQEPLGLIHVEQQCNVTLEDCEIGAIFLDLPESIEYNIDSLVPGYHEYWSAREFISNQLPYQLIMRRCTLNDNDVGYDGGMEMGWNLSFNAIYSKARITNSKLNKIIFGFPKGEPAIANGLKIREPINFTLNNIVISNTNVQTQWGIFVEEAPATLSDCEGLFIFMTGGTAPVNVINSEVYEIDPRKYRGTMIFDHSIFGGGYEVFDSSHIFLVGSIRARNPMAILDPTSKITRIHEFNILFDSDGSPFPPFPMRIIQDSQLIWEGVADLTGKVEIEITYDLTNYQDDWIIESTEPTVSLHKKFGLNASNPITINLRKEELDTVFHPVVHVKPGATEFPDGSRFHPFPTIQEAIDNSSGETILLPAGIYSGTKPPGADQAIVTLSDQVHIIGAGADSTILEAKVVGEAFQNASITGIEVKEGFHFLNASITIRNCIVSKHSDHALIGVGGNLSIYNNTFVSNAGDATFLTDSAVADIRNNIFVSNDHFGIEAHLGTIVQADYNNLWANGDNYVHADLIGPHDLSVDPLFVDTEEENYRLEVGSRCIDAGDPRIQFNDRDGSRNDMGALGGPFGRTTTANNLTPTDNITLSVTPNPITNQARIDLFIPVTDRVHLAIYDLKGKLVQTLMDKLFFKGEYVLSWSSGNIPSGLFILRLQASYGLVTQKMVVL